MLLHRARQELLDLGLRNPLLNYRPLRARGLTITGENPADLYRLLVREAIPMDFLEATPSLVPSPQSQLDHHLQTPYDAAELQKRLLTTDYIARTYLDDHGVNTLYLALGMVEWRERDTAASPPRLAPLILVPVQLERATAAERFHLRHTGLEPTPNLSLATKLRLDFGLELPLFEEDEHFDVDGYLTAVQNALAPQPNWRVDGTAVALAFFAFDKYLLYRDLDPDQWHIPPDQHPILSRLLDEQASFQAIGTGDRGQGTRDSGRGTGDTSLVPSPQSHLVLDADSSQLEALSAVLDGHSMVIQGPPGTGKSQTIANLIAELIGRGKTVLFVAEKMAALEVVKRRLDGVGLGEAVLELHSHKSTKASVAAELGRTLALGQPKEDGRYPHLDELRRAHDELAERTAQMNTPIGESGRTPYDIYGRLLQLRPHLPQPLLDLPLPGLSSWSAETFARHHAALGDWQRLLAGIGTPGQHPFAPWPITERQPEHTARLRRAAQTALATLEALRLAATHLAAELAGTAAPPLPDSPFISYAESLLESGRELATAPNLFAVQAGAGEWYTSAPSLATALEVGTRLAVLYQQGGEWLIPSAWGQDVFALRQPLVTSGRRRTLRWLSGSYRRALATLRGLAQPNLPDDPELHVALVDAVLEAQQLIPQLAPHEPLLQTLFGQRWQGVAQSNWNELAAVGHWLMAFHKRVAEGGAPAELLGYLGRGLDHTARQRMVGLTADLEAAWAAHHAAEAELAALGLPSEPSAAYPALRQQLQRRHDAADDVPAWVAIHQQTAELRAAGLAPALEAIWQWPPAPTATADWLEHQYLLALLGRVEGRLVQSVGVGLVPTPQPEDNQSSGQPQGLPLPEEPPQLPITNYQLLDRDWLHHNRRWLAHWHWQNIPPYQAGGQVGLLLAETAKRRNHRPIRQLLAETAEAIQRLKPIFMMSPLSIATYLPPDRVAFDVVIFDEASQVRPVEAFGAILRGRQAIIVGDSRQMPPTSFFERLIGGEGQETGDEGHETGEGFASPQSPVPSPESVLDLFLARQAPQMWLRWHYRSRHETLIATSNQLFYDNQLVLFPSPDAGRSEAGLRLRHLPEAVYERGRSRTNPAEAQAIVEAIFQHAHSQPALSLGVATFSTAQREAISDALEAARRNDPSAEEFLASHPHEPFFIKNLENVQGDERDVVLVSLGYGRDEAGRLSLNFGPLNNVGGERRLNVLMTRARQRCELFSNLRAEDIDLRRTQAEGVVALRAFLALAETGETAVHAPAHPRPITPFEEVVTAALTSAGHSATPRVGQFGVVLDVAVRDPGHAGRYLLGVVTDGPSYAAVPTVRDRERIQPAVLAGLGWRLHHVSAADWFHRPEEERGKLLAAVTAEATSAPQTADPATEIARYAPEPRGLRPITPYQRSSAPLSLYEREGWRSSPHDTAVLMSQHYYWYDPAAQQVTTERIGDGFFSQKISGGLANAQAGQTVLGRIYMRLDLHLRTGEIRVAPYHVVFLITETHQHTLRFDVQTRALSFERRNGEQLETYRYHPRSGLVERTTAVQLAQLPVVDKPLVTAELEAAVRTEAEWVAQVVADEGPLHAEELARAMATAAGLTRRSPLVDQICATAAEYAAARGLITQRGVFWWPAGMDVNAPPVRQRGELPAVSRKLEFVADEELLAAVDLAVGDAISLHPQELPGQVGPLLGFGVLGGANHARILQVVAQGLRDGRFWVEGALMRLPREGEGGTAVTDELFLRGWLGLPEVVEETTEVAPTNETTNVVPYVVGPLPNPLAVHDKGGWGYDSNRNHWFSKGWYRWLDGLYTAETMAINPTKQLHDFPPNWSGWDPLGTTQYALFGRLFYDPWAGTWAGESFLVLRVQRLARQDVFYRLWRDPETGLFYGRWQKGDKRPRQVAFNKYEVQFEWATRKVKPVDGGGNALAQMVPATVVPELAGGFAAKEEGEMTDLVAVEGPIHMEELKRRFAVGAGYKGRSSLMDGYVERLVGQMVAGGRLVRRGDFVWEVGQTAVVPRYRGDLPPVSRNLTLVAPEELALVAGEPAAVGQLLLGKGRLSGEEVAWLGQNRR